MSHLIDLKDYITTLVSITVREPRTFSGALPPRRGAVSHLCYYFSKAKNFKICHENWFIPHHGIIAETSVYDTSKTFP